MEEYRCFLNQIIGYASMGLAMAALSTERPQLFGCIFFGITIIHLLTEAHFFFQQIPQPMAKDVLINILGYTPYFIGLLMLFSVAAGWLNKSGFTF